MSRRPLSARNADPPTGGKARMERSRFPLIPRKELVESLRQLGGLPQDGAFEVNVTEGDLLRPTPEKVQEVYFMCLSILFEFSPDSFKQAKFLEIDHLELLDDYISRMKFFKVMKTLMHICLVDDFSMKDLVCPEQKRFCRNLSGIVNYAKFIYNFIPESIHDFREANDQMYADLVASQEENREVKEQLDAIERQRSEEHELEVEFKRNIVSQEQQIHALQQELESLQLQLQSQAELSAACEQRMSELCYTREKLAHHKEELHSQIVSSPDKFKAHLSKLQSDLEPMKERREQSEHLLRMWENLVSRAHQVPSVLQGANEDIDRLMMKGEERSHLLDQLESMKEKMCRQNQALREAIAKHQNLQSHLKIKSDEARQITQTYSHSSSTEDLERELRDIQQELLKKELKEKEYQREAEELKRKHGEKMAAHAKKLQVSSVLVHTLETARKEEMAAMKHVTDKLSHK